MTKYVLSPKASCSFGCNSVGSSGFTCGCPRGYRGLNGGHCMVVNDPGLFYDDGDDNGAFEYLEEGEEADEDVVSTEGCFACKMNGGGGTTRRRRIMAR